MNNLNGYKTYTIVFVMILFALFGMYIGVISSSDGIQVILAALGLAGVRHGITTESQKNLEKLAQAMLNQYLENKANVDMQLYLDKQLPAASGNASPQPTESKV